MKIAVVGAGAIGGFLACKLFAAGHDVTVIAHGANLTAIQENGLQLHSIDELLVAQVNVTSRPKDLCVQDMIIFAVNAPSLPDAAEEASVLIGAQTIIIPAINGLPWWYFLKCSSLLSGTRLSSVDPLSIIEKNLPIDAVVGCVVFPSCKVLAPGIIKHVSGTKIIFGEPGGGFSNRVSLIAGIFSDAGFDAHSHENIREEIWIKLLGYACSNPVSLLGNCSTDQMIDDVFLRTLFIEMMSEILDLGQKLEIYPDIDPQQRIAITRKLGNVGTSIGQDLENYQHLEIEGTLGLLVSTANLIGVTIPRTFAVYALARMKAKNISLSSTR